MERGSRIIERKVKPDGTVREYSCTLVRAAPGLVIVRFDMPSVGETFATPVAVPPGAHSLGFFWKRRPFNVYRILTGTGEVLAHRFDAITDVQISPGRIEYHDLVLDWWALPDGTLIQEDQEEFDDLVMAGKLSVQDVDAAMTAARTVTSRYRHIIDEIERLAARPSRRRGNQPRDLADGGS